MNQKHPIYLALLLVLAFWGSHSSAQDLTSAIRSGDLEGIEKAVKADPEALKGQQGQPPLILALQSGQTAAAKKLIELGADLTATNNQGHSVLHWAIMRRNDEMVQTLIDKEVDLDVKDRNQYTPLIMAIYYGNTDAAKKLLEADCRVDVEDQQGMSPLHAAMNRGDDALIGMLLERGCDMFDKNKQDVTPFMLACQSGQLKFVKEHFDASKAAEKSKNGQTCLLYATYSNQAGVVKYLCEQTDLVNVADKNGQTPLKVAVSYDNPDMVMTLLKHSADPNVKSVNDYDFAPIIAASNNANPKIVVALLEAGAKTTALEPQTGNQALHVACRSASPQFGQANPELMKRAAKVIQALLDAEADPNAKNKSEQTPLEIAIQSNFAQGIDLLIRRTKDVDIDLGQKSFLHWACEMNMANAVEVLLERDKSKVNVADAQGQTPLCIASASGNQAIVKSLVDAGAKVNQMADDGQTPIHAAVSSKSSEVLKLMIEQGADLTLQDGSGRVPLHVAAWFGNVDAIKILASRSVNMTPVTQTGSTPLHLAAWQDQVEAAAALLDFGVDINQKDADGWTPLHKAAHRGNVKMVKLLLDRGADKSVTDSLGLTALQKVGGAQKDAIEKMLK